MKLSTRLTASMVALVVLTAAAVGLLIDRNLNQRALPRILERIDTHTRLLANQLEASVRGAMYDVSVQGGGIDNLVRANLAGGIHPDTGTTEAQWRERLASRFVAELEAKPHYLQFSLIAVVDGGRELVRVDRLAQGGGIRVVPVVELQRVGDRDDFKAAVALPSDHTYASSVDLDRVRSASETLPVPTLRVAAPVFTSDGKTFGILIVTIDMRVPLNAIRAASDDERHIYVVNSAGDYLAHPDRTKELGLEIGSPFRIQDEFPEFTKLLAEEDTPPRILRDRSGEQFGIGWEAVRLAGGPRVAVVEAIPYQRLIAASTVIPSLLGAFAVVLCAIPFAVLLARSLIRPLEQMTKAVEGFGHGESVAVPLDAGGEIGVLARAFTRMTADVREKTAALKHEMEERSRIVETSPDLILVTDAQGNFIRVNPSSKAILGYDPEEMIGHNGIEFIYPDDLDPTRNEMRMARRGRQMRNFETRYVHKDGRVVTLTWSGVWSEPERRHFFIGRDMTEQLFAEEKFRLAVDASPNGIVMIDLGGRMVLVNAETERLFGYRREELIGQSIDMLVAAGLREAHARHRSAFMAHPKARHMGDSRELNGLRKDGSEVPIEVGLHPIQSRNGLLVMSVIVDVSARKEAEEKLRESERLARGIIANSLDAIIQVSEAGVVIEWNPQAESIFCWSREEAVGRPITELYLPSGYQPRYIEMNERLQKSGGIVGDRFVFEAQRKDGQKIKVEVSMTGFRRRNGNVFNLFLRDITAKIAAEEQLRQAQKMEAVGQLTGGIAHDFNNMLTVITGTIDILGEAVADKPQLAAIAKLISEAADRGAELTGHLLSFARKQPLQPREIDINSLVAESSRLLRPALGEQVEIESMLEPDLWPALVDPTQLTTALLNLAVNARDAMPNGGKLILETKNVVFDSGYVEMNGDVQPGNYVMLAVSDTGTGIPEEIRSKVFEPFFSTKEVGKGTGLGLSMVYGFVKQSGGHIKIYSEEGHGTTIRIYLPQAGAQSVAATETAIERSIEGGNETILIVEDNLLVLNSVSTQLASLGYKTLSAANAGEALALVDSGAAFDLLFTDVIMPGAMNGSELAGEVIRRRPSVKVLFTSGYTENAIVHHGRLDPGVLLLAKPYRKSDLARMVRAALLAAAAPQPNADTRRAQTG